MKEPFLKPTPSEGAKLFDELLRQGKSRKEIIKIMNIDHQGFYAYLQHSEHRMAINDSRITENNFRKLKTIWLRIVELHYMIQSEQDEFLKESYEKEFETICLIYIQTNPMDDIIELPLNLKDEQRLIIQRNPNQQHGKF